MPRKKAMMNYVQTTQGAQRLRARRPLTDNEFDERFNQLVDRVDPASVSGEHWVAMTFWWHAARRAYETGNLDQLAKLFRSGVPHSRQIDQMLADLFDSCKLTKGKRKLFESAAARYDLAERDVRRLMSGELKLLGELSTKQMVWQDPLGNPVEVRSPAGPLKMKQVHLLKVDAKSARSWDANAHELSKRRDSKGHMPREAAIELVASIFGLEADKLANWMDRKTGASRSYYKKKLAREKR
jgi:hypothetical protein